MRKLFLFVFAGFSLFIAAPLQAALFDGQFVRLTYEYPDMDTVYNNLTTTFIVGAGAEAQGWPDPYWSWDFSDSNITATINYPVSGGGTGPTFISSNFNGFHVFDLNGTIPGITSVTITPATNMVGLNTSRITFDANNIYMNLAALSYSNTTISLDVNSQSVPEPTTLLLLGLGLVGLAGIRRRMHK
jgi:hypothetical protein